MASIFQRRQYEEIARIISVCKDDELKKKMAVHFSLELFTKQEGFKIEKFIKACNSVVTSK